MIERRYFTFSCLAAAGALALTGGQSLAGDWRNKFSEIRMGVITSENEADRVSRFKPFNAYLERKLGTRIVVRNASDYAGVIEAMKSRHIELAYLGPASYSKAWLVTKGKVEPLVGVLDNARNFGYYSVLVVKADSPFKVIGDLKGKKLAFADPNSTSGFQAPSFFLREAGYDPDSYFGTTGFSGSHENSVIALMNGTFDAAATWWRSETRSNLTRMAGKGMIADKSWRVIWKSPRLPSSPYVVHTDMPAEMKADIKAALMALPKEDPAAWKALTDGKESGFREVTHKDYEPIVRMIKENLRKRKSS